MEKDFRQDIKPEILKFVLYGPESTGKTTLAKQLAAHYNTVWVPEYMRTYFEKKRKGKSGKSVVEDLEPIAKGQINWENEQLLKANKHLFCDTDLLELKVYAEAYFNGYCPPKIATFAHQNTYTLYFLTYIDTPWQTDGLRDRPNEREKMFNAFENALIKAKKPYLILKGNQEERLQRAIKVIEKRR